MDYILPYVLFCPGTIAFIFSLIEIFEEIRFKKNSIKVKAIVTGKIPARYASRKYEYHTGTGDTIESKGGFLLNLEYEAEDGYIYSHKTKKTFTGDETEIEVLYAPNDPTDIMVDSFYKVGNAKYWRLIFGFILGIIIPTIAVIFLQSNI